MIDRLTTNGPLAIAVWTVMFGLSWGWPASSWGQADSLRPGLQAGAAAVDITPRQWPVRVNGQFLESSADHAVDPLYARCLVLQSGSAKVAVVVVDSCMIPREVCDEAKRLATDRCGMAGDRILIAATHNHSSPGVMDFCLGSRSDPAYTAYLPVKIAEAIEQAIAKMEPAEWGTCVVETQGFTANRRWITRCDTRLSDPFGDASVHANMHPGFDNPQFTGPSGPIDPALTLLSVRSRSGRPLALLANFSMHYFGGHPGLSADYCGLFANLVQQRFAAGDDSFVGILSQGTSGDLWWGDYSRPKIDRTMDEYTRALVDLAEPAFRAISYRSDAEVAMVERRMMLDRRTPSPERLTWARDLLKTMEGRRPSSLPEVYAEQAVYLHEHPTAEIVLQAIRVGDFAITAMPNEVYALTGLKLKLQSPLPVTMNIELANGADGYIPPPEQHRLGGYTTWPARTAGLEVQAEPKVVENLLQMLEQLAEKPRRTSIESSGHYAKTILADQPLAYYRMSEWTDDQANDSSGHHRSAEWRGDVAFFLPGPEGEAFSDQQPNRSIHSVGASLTIPIALPDEGTVEVWFWNGLIESHRAITGKLVIWDGTAIQISGHGHAQSGRMAIGERIGDVPIVRHTWHHLVVSRSAAKWQVFVNGKLELTADLDQTVDRSGAIVLGGTPDDPFAFEGRFDEVAVYDRPFSADDVAKHYAARMATVPASEGRHGK